MMLAARLTAIGTVIDLGLIESKDPLVNGKMNFYKRMAESHSPTGVDDRVVGRSTAQGHSLMGTMHSH